MKKFFSNIYKYFIKNIIDFFKGIILGASMVVPGVSGGTMALIIGIYNKIIHAINNIFKSFKKHFPFLLIVGLGAVLGILLLGNLLEKALETFPSVTNYLFIGVVIGSLPIVFKESEVNLLEKTKTKRIPFEIFLLLAGAALIIGISFLKQDIVSLTTKTGFISSIFNVFAGFLVAVALVLPGISGSLFLKSLGLYETFLSAISISSFDFLFLLPFGIGLIVGVLVTAKLIESFIEKHKRSTFIVILGFLIGTIITMFMDTEYLPSGITIAYSIIALVLGIAFMLTIFFINRNKQNKVSSNTTDDNIKSGGILDAILTTTNITPEDDNQMLQDSILENNTDNIDNVIENSKNETSIITQKNTQGSHTVKVVDNTQNKDTIK